MVQRLILKPCPFCGHWRCEIEREGSEDRYYVLCDYGKGGCGATGGRRSSSEGAAAAWNDRREEERG